MKKFNFMVRDFFLPLRGGKISASLSHIIVNVTSAAITNDPNSTIAQTQ